MTEVSIHRMERVWHEAPWPVPQWLRNVLEKGPKWLHRVITNPFPWRIRKPIDRDFPDEWKELNRKQFLFISNMRLRPEEIELRKMWLFWMLADLPMHYAKAMQVENLDPDLLKLLDWPFAANVNYVESLLPAITVRGRKWHGPERRLRNMSIKQFGFANELNQRFLSTQNDDDLNLLLACLYQPGDLLGRRKPFNNELIERFAVRIAKVPAEVRTAAFFNFTCLHSYLPGMYPMTFDAVGEKDSNSNIERTIIDLAGDKFGTVDATAERGIHEVLPYVEMMLERAEKREKQQ